MARIEIEYSVPHGYRRRAEDVKERIAEEFGDTVEEVTLVEGGKMDFLVRLDGALVYDKKKAGYDPDKVVRKLSARLTPDDEGED